jgi:putative serine protease PepD
MSNDLFWPPAPPTPEPFAQPIGADEPPRDTVPLDAGESAPKPRAWKTSAATAGVAALVFGALGVGVGAALHGNGNGSQSPNNAGFTIAGVSSNAAVSDPKSYAAIAAKVLPSVVSINVITNDGGDTGSGVILRSDGYILTNNHVISAAQSGAGTISVTFNDGTSTRARIIGADQEDDLAVIKVDKTGLVAATLGSASGVRVGDPVLAVGSPLGLQGTVTSGIVSSVNRPVGTSDSSQQSPFGGSQSTAATTVIDAIQTDAAINPGNSGGPLVNAAGDVIGINSAIASTGAQSGNIGVGFAIPIDQAKVVAQQLITTGKATHPLLGVSIGDATDSNGNPLARVQSVASGGPAAKAGIQAGDVIVAVGGQATAGAQAAIAAIRTHQPGDQVAVTVLRNGQRKTFTVTLVDASSAQG